MTIFARVFTYKPFLRLLLLFFLKYLNSESLKKDFPTPFSFDFSSSSALWSSDISLEASSGLGLGLFADSFSFFCSSILCMLINSSIRGACSGSFFSSAGLFSLLSFTRPPALSFFRFWARRYPKLSSSYFIIIKNRYERRQSSKITISFLLEVLIRCFATFLSNFLISGNPSSTQSRSFFLIRKSTQGLRALTLTDLFPVRNNPISPK